MGCAMESVVVHNSFDRADSVAQPVSPDCATLSIEVFCCASPRIPLRNSRVTAALLRTSSFLPAQQLPSLQQCYALLTMIVRNSHLSGWDYDPGIAR